MTTGTTAPDPDAAPTAPAAPDPEPHARFFSTGRAQVVDEHDGVLWDALSGLTEGGKRFRPTLLLRMHEALGGTDRRAAARVADAVELLHTAFVVHDDVIDGDVVRRGRPNVTGTFTARAVTAGATPDRARHYGEAAGILAGDLALAGAVREVALCGARPEQVVQLLDLLEEVLHRSAAGELADVRVSLTGDASLEETRDIACWKTAAYSFELPMQAAAILADADEQVVEALGEAGRCLGLAFQLRDDLDGVFGTAEQTGKDPLCDLREGKCTALVAFARSSRLWPELARYVGDPHLTEEGAARARQILVACGARSAVEAMAAELAASAISATRRLPAGAADALRAMVHRLVPVEPTQTDLPGSLLATAPVLPAADDVALAGPAPAPARGAA
ncbi:polyprenyl synthetase family protein [Ornithinimicrobium pekingense]|uniref:Geranylgeranyl pyrophosphate synthase n=1 Tax=Ornithinimicrobium pekingense TaxID=384677 RepID=A0ABQ2F2N8_9MICO|nr:polyprenyl synthetase family protein [Ornithinimicrobium pekingense]GGK56161.1 geranylgeranyl pyrophosphate synthase [Ornithinimicrobium pekingense]